MDAERRQWLDTLSKVCEDVLRDVAEAEAATRHYPRRALVEDVTELLSRLRAELDAGAT
jgi:hypothetical protein